jgi:hypothetical protein
MEIEGDFGFSGEATKALNFAPLLKAGLSQLFLKIVEQSELQFLLF